jgi:gluconate:H+ symporter, GntP family
LGQAAVSSRFSLFRTVLVSVWWLVLAATTLILVGILWFRTHAMLVLLAAAFLVAVMTPAATLTRYAQDQVASRQMSESAAASLMKSSGPKRLATAFGQTAGEVGILIALASVVGICLMESGAAHGIVTAMLRFCGVKRAPEGLAISAFVLSIPVFFDTVFYLMVPLARSLRRQTGKDYVLYILAIMAGGSIAHSLVPPTPGPLQVAEILGIDIFTMMVAGLGIGGASSFLSLMSARLISRWTNVPLRPLGADGGDETDDLASNDDSRGDCAVAGDCGSNAIESQATGGAPLATPPLFFSLLPILLPVLLIGYGAIDAVAQFPLPESFSAVMRLASDKNVAMGIAAAVALQLLRYTPETHDRKGAVSRALASGGQIILITSAGGALGSMLRQAGIASAVADLTSEVPASLLLVVVFAVTASIRTLQGSATVSMITAAGVLQGLADVGTLPFHPVYVAMAIGAGSKPLCWMTDSGFWIMCKMSGMTDREGLRTVSVLSVAMGFSALIVTILAAMIFPAI